MRARAVRIAWRPYTTSRHLRTRAHAESRRPVKDGPATARSPAELESRALDPTGRGEERKATGARAARHSGAGGRSMGDPRVSRRERHERAHRRAAAATRTPSSLPGSRRASHECSRASGPTHTHTPPASRCDPHDREHGRRGAHDGGGCDENCASIETRGRVALEGALRQQAHTPESRRRHQGVE